MTFERWKELMENLDTELTQEELQEGWHFCYDWDGLLVGPGTNERLHCNCVFS